MVQKKQSKVKKNAKQVSRWQTPPKTHKGAWFVAVRGSYLPCSWQGWTLYALFGAYLVLSAIVGWREAADYAKVVFFVLPNWVAAAVAMTWLAKQTS